MIRPGRSAAASDCRITRRHLLGLGAYGALACALPRPAQAARVDSASERALAFYNTHTGERLRSVYWADGDYQPASLREIDHLLRDHRTGDVLAIDPNLLELLHRIHVELATSEPFHVISGYRSPATNAKLRAQGGGVGRRSLHMQGKAIDIFVPGREVSELHRIARAQRSGGVGHYPKPGFVHVDVGRVRYW